MYIEYLCVSMQFSSLCMRKIGAVPVGFFPSRGMKCETPVFKPYDQTSNFIQRSANTNTGKHMKQASTGWPRIHIYIERIVYIYIFEYTVQCKHYIVIHTYIYMPLISLTLYLPCIHLVTFEFSSRQVLTKLRALHAEPVEPKETAE